ncbi:unnamed protein product [Urochloa humidicola]
MFHQVCRTQKMQGKGRVRSTWLRVFYKQYSSTLVNSHAAAGHGNHPGHEDTMVVSAATRKLIWFRYL